MSIQLKCVRNLGSSGVYWPSIQQRIAWQNVPFGSFTSNIERRSVGSSETDEMWVLTVWELFAIACTSKEVIANLIRIFVGATAEEIGNDYYPSQQLWLDAGENRGSHSLCTISVNVDCRDEFVRDCEKPLHGSSDLSRSQEAERILLCETVNSCWQWIRSKHHVRVPKRCSYYLVNNSIRSRNHAISVTLNLGAVRIIWRACKPVHILYIKRLHPRVCSQSALILL